MSSFNRCACVFCSRNKLKLISYLQCTNIKCGVTGYFRRISRIDKYNDKIHSVCGFKCDECGEIVKYRDTCVPSLFNNIENCPCEVGESSRISNSKYVCCWCCEKVLMMQRVRRTHKYVDTTGLQCGYLCPHCDYVNPFTS